MNAKLLIFILFFIQPMFYAVNSASAESQPETRQQPSFSFSYSYAPIYQFETDLDSGGKFDVLRHYFRFDVSRPLNQRLAIGVGLNYDYENWDFNEVSNIAGADPWQEIHRPGISVPVFYALSQEWRLGLVPAVEFSGTSGAELDESLTYGAVVSLAHAFSADLYIGFGAGVFDRLEKVEAFPFLIIDWKISEQFRLTNPFRAGPAGPAGLELVFTPFEQWKFGIGGAYRSYRFRLDDRSAIPNGIGEVESLVTFLRSARHFGPMLKLDVVVGMFFNGKISIENAGGDDIGSTGYDSAAFAALSFSGRF